MRNRLEIFIPTHRLHTDEVDECKLEEAARVAGRLHTLLSTITRVVGGMTFTSCVGEWRGIREDITRFTWWHEAWLTADLSSVEQTVNEIVNCLIEAGEQSVMLVTLTQHHSGQHERAHFCPTGYDEFELPARSTI